MAIDRERVKLTGEYLLRRVARRFGWHLVRADYYSPIVDTRLLSDSVFTRQAPMHGINLRIEAQLELVERTLAPYLHEWQPPLRREGNGLGFYLLNPFYGPLDAHILYGLLRELRPRRLIELGSGFSTLVIRQAAQANARQGADLDHTVIDPHPSYLLAGTDREFRQVARPGDQVELSVFKQLRAGDVLFVDTTHVVKLGGEVVYLLLDVLPALSPGVVIHFHDIFRPFDYPRLFFDLHNKHWQEHYLLEAFLAFNPNFSVICANHALARLYHDRMRALMPSLEPEMAPSGFWLEKLGAEHGERVETGDRL